MNIRIIPRLDIKGPNLVKGIGFEGLRVLGRPEHFAKSYYEAGADELVYIDAVASLYGRNSLHDIVERTSCQVFIPLCVGGGLRSVEDVRAVLRAGADKVALNSAAVARPQLIREVALAFGSSTVVVAIDARRRSDGTYEVSTDYGRQVTNVDAGAWARQAVELGAGELMVTSVDREGTGTGFDVDLVRLVAQAVNVPVIAGGGAGSPRHVTDLIQQTGVEAVSLASLLHYDVYKAANYEDSTFRSEGNLEFMKAGRPPGRIAASTVAEVKSALRAANLACR